MRIAVANIKGGVGKTTTAIHLAACLHTLSPTVLLDGDKSRNATAWSTRGEGLPFRVASNNLASLFGGVYTHTVLDTGQAPSDEDFRDYIEGFDILVVPAMPSANANEALLQTIKTMVALRATNFRVLINAVAPPPQTDAARLRSLLSNGHVPTLAQEVPRLKVIEQASALGTTVNDTAIYSAKDRPRAARAWEAYQAITQELLHA